MSTDIVVDVVVIVNVVVVVVVYDVDNVDPEDK